MHRSPRSTSSSQSPIDPHDRGRERARVEYRRASRSPPPFPPAHGGARTSQHQQQGSSTALPSIRNLHLPPPHAHRHAAPAQQYSPSEFLPSASYGPSSFFAGTQRSPALPSNAYPPPAYDERRRSFDRPLPGARSQQQQQPSSSAYPEQRISPPEADSDQDQNDSERGPPKKKRRRQALSCTECKRRKIKCDRTHPCGPCARRSEPDKCQWHVIEPVAHRAFRPAGVSYSDKYVTRSEWDDLYAKYRVLEDRCIRLEKLFVQLHPELVEEQPYELTTINPAMLTSSPTAARAVASRGYSLAGPGISGPGASSARGSQRERVTPNTPVSALVGPGPSPRHGPPSSVSAHPNPIGTGTRAESSASTRSGSAPPPMLASTTKTTTTTQQQQQTTGVVLLSHPPPHSDRRTSASGSHASFLAPSERSSVVPYHQVQETAQARRPFTAAPAAAATRSPPSYTFPPPPPPPPPDKPPVYSSPRIRSAYVQGRSTAVPEPSTVSSPRAYATRPPASARPYPSPLSAEVQSGRHVHIDEPPEMEDMDIEERYARDSSRYERDTRYERREMYDRPRSVFERRDSDSKNGKAQTSEADDALRHPRSSASFAGVGDAGGRRPTFSSRQHIKPDPDAPASASASESMSMSPILEHGNHDGYAYSHSDGSLPPSPRFDSHEVSASASSRRRVHPGTLYLNIPSCGSAPETPPPAVVVH